MAALRARIAKDQTRALLVQILGIGAMIGGAVAGGDSGKEIGSAGQGVMMGGNELIMRGLLGERRARGRPPIRPASVPEATRQSGRGILTTLSASPVGSCSRTPEGRLRPQPSCGPDRLARRQLAGRPYYAVADPPELSCAMTMRDSRYIRPSVIFNRYPVSDNSLPARCAGRRQTRGQGGVRQRWRSTGHPRAGNPYFWGSRAISAKAGRPAGHL
jgi:hypothetical protein